MCVSKVMCSSGFECVLFILEGCGGFCWLKKGKKCVFSDKILNKSMDLTLCRTIINSNWILSLRF
ncbi:hypothetical protein BpHYR1_005592 [Brachionus plicatilis]|uniref:Uncharacterized protein n=1 Tax=Brachionus plicatilis TaxID=10195 RepID=A0A3M7RHY4_BRAPC|nr:hypothetical protein BpHYR1_005592 [Brachionus plicatilis]